MRDTMTTGAWVGGAILISVSLMVLCQHAEGERTRAALQVEQTQVDSRIRTLDARLTDIQADSNRKKLASVVNPPLDPRRLAKASRELDQLIAGRQASPAPADDSVLTGPAGQAQPASPPVGAPEATGDLVRICPGGHFYHRPGCPRVRKQTLSVARSEAATRGYRPCPTCKP